MDNQSFLAPDWPVSPGVRAVVTTRLGGVSRGAFETLNLALHVGDDVADVTRNRERLQRALQLPGAPNWMNQVHGTGCLAVTANRTDVCDGDAAWTDRRNVVLVVMVADCLPIFIASRAGDEVAVVHAGWRGLAGGVIESAVARFRQRDLVAWMGPAIGPCHYEVDGRVREAFPEGFAFSNGVDKHHWMLDLYAVARHRLARAGVNEVFGGGFCTHCDRERFYSFRRDSTTGRIAALIWRDGE